jgi:hypothetical protein
MFIRDIFMGKYNEEEVHNEFIKFSRGEFKSKYLITGKKAADKWVIKTGPEFVNAVVKLCLDKAPEKVRMTGVIVSTTKIDAPFILGMKQFMGIKQHKVDGEIDKKDIIDMIRNNPRVFYALSFSTPSCELKVKAKAPKSAKPSTSGKEPAADFCSLKTTDKDIVDELFFDDPGFNEISINHTVKITDTIYPKEFMKMKPEEVREQSKRKGILVRNLEVDGKKKVSEAHFLG